VIELVPTGKAVVANVATSFVTVPLPIRVVPLKKLTVPEGAAEAVLAGVILAVNVTDTPKAGELGVKVRAVVVEISVTGTVTAGEVLDVKVLSPEYCAVIELVDETGKVEVANVATPAVIVPVPRNVVPLKNSTVPEGVPVSGLTGATVAVKVTVCPKTGALGEKVRVVVDVAVAATVTVTSGDVLVPKLVSPEYCAVTVLAPAGRAVVVKLATPAAIVPVPSDVVPLKNSTVPVGMPAPGLTAATVAFKVTFWAATGEDGKKVTAVVVDACETGTETGAEVLVA
jgi:hypothetical protein